jgi:hypothetical protein
MRLRTHNGFTSLPLRKLKSEYLEGNKASARALAATGFLTVGRYRVAYFVDGRWVDFVVCELLREDCETSNTEYAGVREVRERERVPASRRRSPRMSSLPTLAGPKDAAADIGSWRGVPSNIASISFSLRGRIGRLIPRSRAGRRMSLPPGVTSLPWRR